jgi:hypothetical protein
MDRAMSSVSSMSGRWTLRYGVHTSEYLLLDLMRADVRYLNSGPAGIGGMFVRHGLDPKDRR